MLRSMFSAISGLRAHQTKMDVTGNNIANVNTVGFKGSQTVFQDTLSQVIRAGGTPAADRGGTNPAQVGLGVKVAGDHHELDPGRHPEHRPLHRLHDRGRRLLRDPRGHREPLHPRRVVRLRRRGQARRARTARSSRAGWPTRTASSTPTARPATCRCPTARSSARSRRPAGSVEGNLPAGRGHRHVVPDQRRDVRQPGRRPEGLLQLHQGGRGRHLDARHHSTPTARTWSPARRSRSTAPAADDAGRPGHPGAVHPAGGDVPGLDRTGHHRPGRDDPVRRGRQPRRARARTATRWARCSPSSSATTARSPASTPTG